MINDANDPNQPRLTFDLLVLPVGADLLEFIEPRGWIAIAGDIVRARKPGGGPSSMLGDGRGIERCDAGGCVMAGISRASACGFFNLIKVHRHGASPLPSGLFTSRLGS